MIITEHDIYLFKQGRHFRLYEKLGAHVMSRLQKVETRKLQLAGTGERLIISDSYNCHNARSPVPARKNILFAGDSLQGEFAAIYIFSKPDQVLPEDLIHSLKQALNPWGLKNLFAWVDLFLRQYRVWLIKRRWEANFPSS